MLERVWRGRNPHHRQECVLVQTCGERRGVLKNKVKSPCDPAAPLLGTHPEDENSNLKRHMTPSVHSSTIYNSQDMEAAWMSISRWVGKEGGLYTFKQNEMMSLAATWIDLEIITQREKADGERQVSYAIIYVSNVKRIIQTNLLTKQK